LVNKLCKMWAILWCNERGRWHAIGHEINFAIAVGRILISTTTHQNNCLQEGDSRTHGYPRTHTHARAHTRHMVHDPRRKTTGRGGWGGTFCCREAMATPPAGVHLMVPLRVITRSHAKSTTAAASQVSLTWNARTSLHALGTTGGLTSPINTVPVDLYPNKRVSPLSCVSEV
jgi:hypothetical protein